jgi:hypothetical protein
MWISTSFCLRTEIGRFGKRLINWYRNDDRRGQGGRNFSDNIRRIRERWYKEQKRLLQLQLRQAQEQGDGERIAELTCRKQNLIKEEQALR